MTIRQARIYHKVQYAQTFMELSFERFRSYTNYNSRERGNKSSYRRLIINNEWESLNPDDNLCIFTKKHLKIYPLEVRSDHPGKGRHHKPALAVAEVGYFICRSNGVQLPFMSCNSKELS